MKRVFALPPVDEDGIIREVHDELVLPVDEHVWVDLVKDRVLELTLRVKSLCFVGEVLLRRVVVEEDFEPATSIDENELIFASLFDVTEH